MNSLDLDGDWMNATLGVRIDGPTDTITGTESGDSLDGTARGDLIQGLDGDDTLNGLHGNDTLEGGSGDDQLFGGRGNDVLVGGAGNNTLNGGNGQDFADFTSDGPISGTLSGAVTTKNGVDFLIGIEGAYLGSGDDHIVGPHRGAIIYDSGGDNFFDMGKGNDQIFLSGDGDNTVKGGEGDDFIQGGDGNDVLIGGGQADTVEGGGGNDFIESAWSVSGGDGKDTILAVDGLTTIDGGRGFDTIDFLNFDHAVSVDAIDGEAAGDVKYSNIERFIGSSLNDSMVAGDAPDAFLGWEGADILIGGAGNDTLEGGRGADTLTGNGGSDKFVFTFAHDSTAGHSDEIQDLSNDDLIDLSHIDADSTTAGNQAFTRVDHFTGVAGQLTLTLDSGSGNTSLEGDTNGDGVADFVVILDGNQTGFANFSL